MAIQRILYRGVTKVLTKFKRIALSEKEKYGNSYFIEAMHLYPQHVYTTAWLIGGSLYTFVYNYDNLKRIDQDYRPYKHQYTIIRPDDPSIDNIKSFAHLYDK